MYESEDTAFNPMGFLVGEKSEEEFILPEADVSASNFMDLLLPQQELEDPCYTPVPGAANNRIDYKFTLDVKGVKYQCEVWDGKTAPPIHGEDYVVIDTETHLIVKGMPLVPVIGQILFPKQKRIVLIYWYDFHYFDMMHAMHPNCHWYFHNASFDMNVMGARKKPEFWQKVIDKQVWCTGIRFQLWSMGKGDFADKWGMDYIAKKILGIEISKDEKIRLTFRRDVEVTLEQWRYAALDVIYTGMFLPIIGQEPLATENLQIRASMVLSRMSDNGYPVDVGIMTRLRDGDPNDPHDKGIQGKFDAAAEILDIFGLRKGEPGIKKVTQELFEMLEHKTGIKFPLTTVDKDRRIPNEFLQEMEKELGALPPLLKAVKDATHYNKMISTYLNPVHVAADGRVHTYFSVLKSTGRTGSSRPNIQNLPRGDGIRTMYKMPKGKVLLAVDFGFAELVALADYCYRQYGISDLRDVIMSGKDPHTHMGTLIEARAQNIPEGMKFRQLAKVPNFGYPGGMGAASLVNYAKATYGIDISEELAKELKTIWLESDRAFKQHLNPPKDFASLPKNISKYCKTQGWDACGSVDKLKTKVHYHNNQVRSGELGDKAEVIDWGDVEWQITTYEARTITGRVRRNATYNSACNAPFQGLAADGAKEALWLLHEDGYSDRMINFIHDEVHIMLDEDEHLADHVRRVEYLMKLGFSKACPYTPVLAESTLSRAWYKEAEPVFDYKGDLQVWESGVKYPKDSNGNLRILEKGMVCENNEEGKLIVIKEADMLTA